MPLRLTVPSIHPTDCEQTPDGVWHWHTDHGEWELRLDHGYHFRVKHDAGTRELLLQPLTLRDAVSFSWGFSWGYPAGVMDTCASFSNELDSIEAERQEGGT